MGLSRSTYYDKPSLPADDAAIVAAMIAICDEFEAYGYRRVGAELRHRGMAVNFKKVRRLMREHGLQPKRRRRFVATTDSNHESPIFPDLARDKIVDGPNQVWVADITYIAIATGFVYMAAILDAWSRRVVGYAISRSMDARLAVAALKAAIRARRPPTRCIHHSDTTRTTARNMRPRSTAPSLPTTDSTVQGVGDETHMTMRRPKAS
jgi:putative transposase